MVFFTNLSAPDNVHHKQERTEAYVNENCLQSGTVYIAESQVFWINETGYGFALDYPTIAMHGVSKDLAAFPRECLYVSLDASMPGEEGEENTEVRFVPEDSSCLNLMFQAMSACQRLHPDEEQLSDDDYDADDFCNEADGVHRMPESEQAIITGGQNGAGMVIFEDGHPIPITPRGVNILAEEDRLDILDAAVGRNDDEEEGGVAMESENAEDDAQFDDAD